MERSIGMLIFEAIWYSKEAARDPPPLLPIFLLRCTSLWPQSLQETGMGPSHHLSLIQVSVAFLSLDMSLGSAGALIEFVGYKEALRSYFLTSRFWIRQYSKGGNGPVTGRLSAIHANFFSGPPACLTALFSVTQQTNRFCSHCIQASSCPLQRFWAQLSKI